MQDLKIFTGLPLLYRTRCSLEFSPVNAHGRYGKDSKSHLAHLRAKARQLISKLKSQSTNKYVTRIQTLADSFTAIGGFVHIIHVRDSSGQISRRIQGQSEVFIDGTRSAV